jgi:hypothetical protein
VIRNFLARIGCLTLIVVAVLGAWHFRADISRALGRVDVVASASEPSESLARQAEEKLTSLSNDGDAQVSFTESELQSLLTFRVAPYLPRGIEDPLVDVRDTVIVLSALIRPDELEEFATPELLQQFLADTARVAATLIPGLRRPGMGQVTVTSLQAGALVIPSLAVPFVLQSLEVPGMDASGSDILIPLSPSVSGITMGDASITIRMEAVGG